MRKSRKWLIIAAAVLVAGAAVGVHLYIEHEEHSHHFHAVDRGHLYRSRQPHEEQMREGLARRDVKRIVNLRPEREDPQIFAEEKRVCADMGITMINLPVVEVIPSMDQVREFLTIARRADGATLVHCEHGRNRTSIMVGAYRIVVQDWTVEATCKEMKNYTNLDGQRLDDCRKFLQTVADQRRQLLAQTAPGTTTATSQPTTSTTR